MKNELIDKDHIEQILNAEKLSPEELKTFPGFEKIEKAEAEHIIGTLEMFCEIIVQHVSKKEDHETRRIL